MVNINIFSLPKQFSRKDLFVFFLGMCSAIKISIVGTLALCELFMIPIYILYIRRLLENKLVYKTVLMCLLWLCGIIIANLVNENDSARTMKGIFDNILFALAITGCYWMLKDKPERVLLWAAGSALSALISFYFFKLEDLGEVGAEMWITYAYRPLFAIIGTVLYYKGRRWQAYIVWEAFAIWGLFHLSRNLFLMTSLSICILLFIGEVDSQNKYAKMKRFMHRLIPMAIGLSITFVGAKNTYSYLASNKILGERAYEKYMSQANNKNGLASGREDFFMAWYVIKKNPIYGYGSLAADKNYLGHQYFVETEQYENAANMSTHRKPEQIASHSYILGAWVFAGIFGALFWVYILYLCIVFLKDALFASPKLIGYSVLTIVAFLWEIFFSPFGTRAPTAIIIAFIITQITIAKQERNEIRKNLHYHPIV